MGFPRACSRQGACATAAWGSPQGMCLLGAQLQKPVWWAVGSVYCYMSWEWPSELGFLLCEMELMAPAPSAALGTVKGGEERCLGSSCSSYPLLLGGFPCRTHGTGR